MSPRSDAADVVHNRDASRFEIVLPEGLAFASYRRLGETLLLTHTEVPAALEGRGLAARVVAQALAHARDAGLKVRPLCSYVAAYMRRHSETQDLLER